MSLTELRSPAGSALLTLAAGLVDGDQLKAVEALRATGAGAELAGEALTQATLRAKAVAKFGPDAGQMFFTRAGLEQATRLTVADRRAARLAAAGVRTIADLGCGIGADARAFARAGITVYAVEADPGTAEIAAANTAGLPVTVEHRDAQSVDLTAFDAVFCDPARRAGNRRVFDPRSYSPPWDFIESLTRRPAVIKLGPGIDHALLPGTAEAEWVSVGGEVVEAALWCDRLAEVPRRATVLPGDTGRSSGRGDGTPGGAAQLTGGGTREAEVGPTRAFVYDPDGAVIRSHLVAELADTLGANIADPTIAYLYADEVRATRFARAYRIDLVLPFSLKRLRSTLRERGVGRLTIKKRGSALEPESLRKQLRLDGPNEATVILTRVAGAPVTLLCQPADVS
ncbi:THUMP-like domain-containing protein [Longispora fulva]|uniref:SAM-dependent methyltransferase n=1 Tax=Longispora fulva TaxID=619741 RepID=A0A8J7KJ94_9ACTN|nr:SAM-dependent methyltransferase [Longispora fulva]